LSSPLFSSYLITNHACPIKWIESIDYLMAKVNTSMKDMLRDMQRDLDGHEEGTLDSWRDK